MLNNIKKLVAMEALVCSNSEFWNYIGVRKIS